MKQLNSKTIGLLLFVIAGVLILLRLVYVRQSPPPVLKGVSEGTRMIHEEYRKLGWVNYGNDTWGPPIIERSATNSINTNSKASSPRQP